MEEKKFVYDIESESLLKKSEYMFEGVDGVGYIHSFAITDFDHIYIPSMNEPIIYETDTTSRIRTKIRYGKTDKGLHLLPTEFCINSPMIILGDHFYISQYRNRGLGEKCLTESPRGVMIDRITEKGIITPLKYIIPVENMQDAHLLTSGDGGSVCFDGENLVYSYELIDTVYTLSTDFSVIKKYPAKSKFIEETKFEVVRNATLEQKLKRICELPIYGNIIYDKYADKVTLIDFGTSKIKTVMDSETTMPLYSEGYSAPELILGKNITEKCDYYSIGIIMSEILLSQKNGSDINSRIEEWTGRKEIKDILLSLVQEKPENRPESLENVIVILERLIGNLNTSSCSYSIAIDSRKLVQLKRNSIVEENMTMVQFTNSFLKNEFKQSYGYYDVKDQQYVITGEKMIMKCGYDENEQKMYVTYVGKITADRRNINIKKKLLELLDKYPLY